MGQKLNRRYQVSQSTKPRHLSRNKIRSRYIPVSKFQICDGKNVIKI